jgi:hemolysin activation/secretion protein
VTAEQFAIGGPDSVRGYIQAEQLGDEGYFASMEFRRTLVQKPASNLQALAFVDHGHVYNELPTPFDGPRTLTGAGVGARAVVDRNTSLRLDLGFPLDPNRTSLNYSSMLYAQANHRF